MLREVLVCLVFSVVCYSPCYAKPPHIIFVVADDLGWNDVGWRNPDMLTPNLNRYAHKGVILNDSYVQPVCTPSRTSFMTGYFPYHTGLQYYVILDDQPKYLPSNFTLLPQFLKTAGYDTHMVGKWHLGFCNWKYTPTERGFDTFLGYYNGAEEYYTHMAQNGYDFRYNKSISHAADGEYSAMVYSARAEEIIESHDPTTPLFLYLPFQSVHDPLEVPKRFEDMYSHIQNRSRRLYSGMVSALDEAFGNVTRALEKTGLDKNMLLIFTTDNGGPSYAGANNWPLRGCKTTTWQGGTRGSAFVYSNNLFTKTGYTNNEMIHAVDWFPTILEAAGIKAGYLSGKWTIPAPGIDGISQLDTISQGVASKRREFVYNIDDVSKSSAIRWGDYKLIEGGAGTYNGWYPPPTLTGDDDDTARVTEDDFIAPQYMLFNVKDDPTEHHDIAEKEPKILNLMIQRLSQWKKSLVPAQNPPGDPSSNPKNYNGTWSPGWC